jgi:predicted AAA+ superfamily ATPase
LDKNRLIDFKKFFVYLHSQIGNLLKKEAIGEYLGIKTRYIEDFLYILEKTLFISRAYPFFTDKSKEYSALPKFYFSDVGVLNFIEKSFDYRENNGKILENFIFNELEKNKKFGSDSIKIYKKLSKSEIDFVYDGLDMCIPIEVKSGNKDVTPKIFFSFEEEYGQKTTGYILTNNSALEKKAVGDKELAVIPNWYVGRFLAGKGGAGESY